IMLKKKLLVIDDETNLLLQISRFFRYQGYDVTTAKDGAEAIREAKFSSYDVILQDLKLPDIDGIELLKKLKLLAPMSPVIIITCCSDLETAVETIKAGAVNFVPKPVDLYSLLKMVENACHSSVLSAKAEYVKREKELSLYGRKQTDLILPAQIQNVVKLLAENQETTILLLGETGTGKGVLAKYIHEKTFGEDSPFIEINCASLKEDFLISELFGHEKGAFTDAKMFKPGLFELAKGGKLFLDEIGEMTNQTQLMLLKAIEEKKIRRLGGTTMIEINARIIAATNADLRHLVKTGKFRGDLYFRLNVMPIKLSPLRERRRCIISLANLFLQEFSAKTGKKIVELSPQAVQKLQKYSFPGNIRELRNIIERAVLLCNGRVLNIEHLILDESSESSEAYNKKDEVEVISLEEKEKRHIKKVLEYFGGNRTKAARALGIHRFTLIQKIRKYRLEEKENNSFCC
ncbi:MAG: sigma-54-dependent Fis family transcriptional regulator, partial [Thermoanaerobaculaceae bacterium]|nr:sigma-54-dependent Fis family transcriptional regulator [Thermoanaerobaculaceae bacterium]